MNMFAQPRTQPRPLTVARLALAAGLLALLCGCVLVAGQNAKAAPASTSKAASSALQKPSFVVIQTDDETLDEAHGSSPSWFASDHSWTRARWS